ncbi:porin [Sagittula sp. SSi028]|uniref:porin n=1 Tax=Sagittula sp. SSi028 TaxID=3400636 RepID=UPI003AF4C7D6
MKNILFATTALVGFAGAAAAEVTVSGSAEVGIVGGERYATASDDSGVTQFFTDVEVVFTMTGEADNGLTFGAKIDLDEGDNTLNGQDDDGATWFLAYGNARLDMGDTDGAFDWALQETALVGGTIDDTETDHAGYNGNSGFDGTFDGQVARATYSFADFAAAISAEMDDDGDDDAVYGVGVKYTADFAGTAVGLGLGYQTRDDENDGVAQYDEILGVSADATLANGLKVAVNYSEAWGAGLEEQTYTGIGLGYEMNALGLAANYGVYDVDGEETDGYALVATYDLGGGLAVQAGYADGEERDNFSLGLAMSF